MLCAGARHAVGEDLPAFRDELSELCRLLIVDLRLLLAEEADLFEVLLLEALPRAFASLASLAFTSSAGGMSETCPFEFYLILSRSFRPLKMQPLA